MAVVIILGCSTAPQHPNYGSWRVVLDLGAGKELPLNASFNDDQVFIFYNAAEEIISEEVIIRGDSIIIEHPVFEGILKGIFTADNIRGTFLISGLNRVVPFEMKFGPRHRFMTTNSANYNLSGTWETVFSPDSDEDRYIAKGIFDQKGDKITGTFRTTTGDYRYLEGVVEGDSMKLSTFDAAHAFLFEAHVSDSVMTGMFYSGNHFKEPFVAKRNAQFELPEADSLTFLKEGYDRISFSFPDTQGDTVSLEDEQFRNKVVVVQIMGTWCPNCLDETKYYSDYYKNNKTPELEFISLAFEYAPTVEKAREGIIRLKEKIGVPYQILLAQVGSRDKGKANEKLPMLNKILSYPTTIFIDKKGMVRKIHTGFNGPATGDKYLQFVTEFESFTEKLLQEKP